MRYRFGVGWGLAFLWAFEVHAQQADSGMGSRRAVESEQNAAVELRFGRYYPDIDSEFPGPTPFQDLFGDGDRYLVGLEVDWQMLRIPHVGTLGPGFGAGYTSATGRAQFRTGGSSDQDTSISIFPLYAVGVFRLDVFARDYGIPLVPYGKLGVGYAFWWSTDGENLAREGSLVASGGSQGWQHAVGGMFLLDPLDRQTAKIADSALGINHSYLFGEWYRSTLDGFGSGTSLRVGTDTWMVGIALEM